MTERTIKMSIKKKMVIAFVCLGIFSLITGVLGLMILGFTIRTNNDVLNHYAFAETDVQELISLLNDEGATIRDIIFLEDSGDITSAQQHIESIKELVNSTLNKIQSNLMSDQEKQYYQTITENLEQYRTAREQVIALGQQHKNLEALNYYKDHAEVYKNEITTAANQLMAEKVSQKDDKMDFLDKNQDLAKVLIIGVICICFVACIGLGLMVAKKISTPIKNIAAAVAQMADGNLHIEVPIPKEQDELQLLSSDVSHLIHNLKEVIADISLHLGKVAAGDLTTEFTRTYKGDFISIDTSMKKIVHSLHETMEQIQQSAEQVSRGASQVANGSRILSEGAAEQENEVEALKSMTFSISEQSQQSAQDAQLIDETTQSANAHMQNCSEMMQKMVAAITQINNTSGEISKIIKTIEDIAFQTNILALNAAVEAARAGAAGKGFAVVADEVRNLASKSADAAQNTTQLIEHTIHSVADSAKLADETASALSIAVNDTTQIATKIDDVTSSLLLLRESISHTESSVEQISDVVQTNSATAQESAAASEQLSGQAEMLKALISTFQLKQTSI